MEPLFAHNKKESWDTLKQLGLNYVLPWHVCGNFNEILYASKKVGVPKEERRMEMFRDAYYVAT